MLLKFKSVKLRMIAMSAISLIFFTCNSGNSFAITAGSVCKAVIDKNAEDGRGYDYTYSILLANNGECYSGTHIVDEPDMNSKYVPLQLINNLNNGGNAEFVEAIRVDYHDSVTSVFVNGKAINSETKFNIKKTTKLIIQYNFGGNTYHFSTDVVPSKYMLGGFTIKKGTVQ